MPRVRRSSGSKGRIGKGKQAKSPPASGKGSTPSKSNMFPKPQGKYGGGSSSYGG